MKRTEYGKKMYILNTIGALMFNTFVGIDFIMTFEKGQDYGIAFFMLEILIFIAQAKINIKYETMRTIEYRVKTRTRKTPYIIYEKPRKAKDYLLLNIMDEKHREKKRIQISESEIEYIEYIISTVDEIVRQKKCAIK